MRLEQNEINYWGGEATVRCYKRAINSAIKSHKPLGKGVANKVFRDSKPKLVLRSEQSVVTMRLTETDHVICFSQSHGLFTTKYKFSLVVVKVISSKSH